jgi:hypothetical protein
VSVGFDLPYSSLCRRVRMRVASTIAKLGDCAKLGECAVKRAKHFITAAICRVSIGIDYAEPNKAVTPMS